MAIKERYFLEDVRRVSFSKKYKIMSLWVLTGTHQSPVTQIQFCSQKVGFSLQIDILSGGFELSFKKSCIFYH